MPGKERLTDVAHVLAVASGKGGVGKTTVTVNLALALHALGARVGIFDADIFGPNVPLMLGVHRRKAGQGFVPVARRKGAEPYIQPLERFGLKIMSMGLIVAEDQVINPMAEVAGQVVVETVRSVRWDNLDYLLLDLPPSAGQPQQGLLENLALDGVLLVTTPQDLSLLDSARSLLRYAQAGVPILGLVENMSYFICPGCGERHEIFQHSAQWRPEALIGFFTKDPATLAVGSTYLRVISWNFVCTGLIFTCSGMFQALGNTWPAILSSATRLVTFVVPALLLSQQAGFRIEYVWYVSVPTVTLQAVVSLLLLRREFARRLAFAPS